MNRTKCTFNELETIIKLEFDTTIDYLTIVSNSPLILQPFWTRSDKLEQSYEKIFLY